MCMCMYGGGNISIEQYELVQVCVLNVYKVEPQIIHSTLVHTDLCNVGTQCIQYR